MKILDKAGRYYFIVFAWVFAHMFFCSSVFAEGKYRVEINLPDRTCPGTTLFADNTNPNSSEIVEIDMEGNVVWSYVVPGEIANRARYKDRIVMHVNRLPSNNILFNVQRIGIFEIDRRGKIVWQHRDGDASHDAQRLENGNTLYVRGWVSKGNAHVIEVDPGGKIAWSWDGLKNFDKPPYADISNEGWMHVNAAKRLANGNTMISIRNFNTIIEISPDDTIVWKQELPPGDMPPDKKFEIRSHPHDPEMLENGNILVALTGVSTVVEIDRKTGQSVWKWEHPNRDKQSAHIRDANRLPNGNTLIVEANAITELTKDGSLVWKMVIPTISTFGPKFAYLFKAQRIGSSK